MKSILRLSVLTVFVLTISSCIALKKDVELAKADIKAEHNAKMKVLNDKLVSEIAKINKRLDEIEKTLKIDKKSQQNKMKLSFSTLEELKATIRDINKRIDMVDVTAQKGTSVTQKIVDLENKLEALQKENETVKTELTAKLEEMKPVEDFTVTKDGRIRLPEDSKKTYKQLVKFTRSNSDGKIARKAWELFSRKFDTRKCDVTYWTGEAYFLEKSYNKAIEYYSQIDAKFKRCSKLEASYLRTAQSLYHVGKKDIALKVLKVMKMKYPKTSFKKDIRNLEKKIKKSEKKPVKKGKTTSKKTTKK
jgi:TolA-binding protein